MEEKLKQRLFTPGPTPLPEEVGGGELVGCGQPMKLEKEDV